MIWCNSILWFMKLHILKYHNNDFTDSYLVSVTASETLATGGAFFLVSISWVIWSLRALDDRGGGDIRGVATMAACAYRNHWKSKDDYPSWKIRYTFDRRWFFPFQEKVGDVFCSLDGDFFSLRKSSTNISSILIKMMDGNGVHGSGRIRYDLFTQDQ